MEKVNSFGIYGNNYHYDPIISYWYDYYMYVSVSLPIIN